MRILLTNDDGIGAPGINVMAEHLIRVGHEVIVVAPEAEKSASSHSITVHSPMRVIEKEKNRYAVTGSPVDSVIVACEVIMKGRCDLVVSGINGGPNLGEDVLYSGTVGAAIEAMFFGYPAIAVSLNSRKNEHFSTAARVITELISDGVTEIIKPETILSINVPAVKYEDLKGYKVTRTGRRRYVDFVVEQKDPKGRPIYWLGGENPKWIEEEGTDIAAIIENYVSITPISPKFTDESSFPVVQDWINKLSDNSTGWYSGNEVR